LLGLIALTKAKYSKFATTEPPTEAPWLSIFFKMDEEIFIARQPILNRQQELFAYELLFRRKQSDTQTSVIDDVEATAQVLDNALNNVGVNKLVGHNLAFINCSKELLTSDILYLLDNKTFVLEVLESVKIDDEVVNAVKNFHGKGYTIAIDDFVPSAAEYERISPLLPYTSIVKLEFPATTIEKIEKIVKILHSKQIKVLAEKIETETDFNNCLKAGCDFFQGYFFAKPENLSAQKLSSNAIEVFELLKAISGGREIDKLETQFRNYPELSVNLIKYLNSAAFALRTQITSIRHAISMLGYDNLKRWLLVLAYANKNGTIKEDSPLLNNAIKRGVLFEEIAKSLNLSKEMSEKAYLTGLISHLDALYKVPMQSVLEQIPIDAEISQALLNKQGTLGKSLNLSQAVEVDDIDEIMHSIETLSLSIDDFNKALIKSYDASSPQQTSKPTD
jgi:EAL and modified HD-GYP domain-containing signal transduction protein